MDAPLAVLDNGKCKAEIYETALPGQFTVRYVDVKGATICEEPLSGVSSYHQREREILDRLQQLCEGEKPKSAVLADPGEY
jgi:hypothetical protein